MSENQKPIEIKKKTLVERAGSTIISIVGVGIVGMVSLFSTKHINQIDKNTEVMNSLSSVVSVTTERSDITNKNLIKTVGRLEEVLDKFEKNMDNLSIDIVKLNSKLKELELTTEFRLKALEDKSTN